MTRKILTFAFTGARDLGLVFTPECYTPPGDAGVSQDLFSTSKMPIVLETIHMKLKFAELRLQDLKDLVAGDQLPSDPLARQQIAQEFFVHLIGATEYLAQLVNHSRSLGLPEFKVSVSKVVDKLNTADPLRRCLQGLWLDTKGPFPTDPYSGEGLVYRAINYRHEVVHRNTNPFHFVMSAGPKVAFFWLDPRDHALGRSQQPVDDDMTSMLSELRSRCIQTLAFL